MTHETVYIPEGIAFGDRVLVIPNVLDGFSHSGFLSNSEAIENYSWVDREDPIATFTLRRKSTYLPVVRWFSGEEAHSVTIRSPAGGLILHRDVKFCASVETSLTALLLPDDESPAEDGHFLYQALRELCWTHKDTYLRPSRFWGMQAFEEDKLKALLEQQIAVQCRIADALPGYKDYFNAARTKYPSLRPYLKHLQ